VRPGWWRDELTDGQPGRSTGGTGSGKLGGVTERPRGSYPCPCCGHVVFTEAPGSYDICPICFWEDDIVQLRWPDLAGGANRASLIEAQQTYQRIGVSEERLVEHVRVARFTEPVDPAWRPFDHTLDAVEHRMSGTDYGKTYSGDPASYYYWLR
jgi:Cysteine-rich CPCC